ncbi:MAG: GntR family transcriptional regulator [Pirellulales bacterium]
MPPWPTVLVLYYTGRPQNMFMHVDARNGLAVYDQIVRQVKFAVADGAVRAGELVPSVRELARELAVNPNTVARAYRQLQDDGVLEPVRGTGLTVTAAARRQCQTERAKLIRARLRLVLEEAIQSGLDPQDVQSMVRDQLAAARRIIHKQ